MADSEPPSFGNDDIFANSSDTDSEPYPGIDIHSRPFRPSRSSTFLDTPSTASMEVTPEPVRVPKRGRGGPDPRTPEQMFARWHAMYPQSLPDPATERRAYAGTKGRPLRVLDVSGRRVNVQFYLLKEHPYDGVWVLTTNSGRRQIVQRQPLGKANKMIFLGIGQGDEIATFGFFEWLKDWKFNKEPSGYIISGALDYAPISDADLETYPRLQATGNSPNTPQSSGSVSDSKKSPPQKKQKGTQGGSTTSTLRRSHREKTEPSTYRITVKSFGHYADESFASTSSAFRTPDSASSASRRTTRPKAPKLSQSALRKGSTSSRTKKNKESPPIPNEGTGSSQNPSEDRETLPIRQKSNASLKTKIAPPNVVFRFLINGQGGVRDRRCDNIKDFFEQVQKAAVIEAAATGKDPVHQDVVMCRLTWLADGLQHAVMEDEPEDFEVLLKKMRSCPAGEEGIVEVRRLT